MVHAKLKTRSQSDDAEALQLLAKAPTGAAHVVTAAGGLLAMDGLASSRRAIKAAPFEKLACTITADLVSIGHVSGSHQLGRIMHEV